MSGEKKKQKPSFLKRDSWFSKLTKAEQQIWRLIYYHPTMITSRTEALDLLFCVIGTGLEWGLDGSIVDTTEDNYLTTNKRHIYNIHDEMYEKAVHNTFYKPTMSSFMDRLAVSNVEWAREYNFYLNCLAEQVQANIEKLTTTAHVPHHFYPVCEYSNLMTMPKNVQSDWLELAIETCDLILATDPTCRDGEGHLLNKTNIKLAKKQRVKLLKIREVQRAKEQKGS